MFSPHDHNDKPKILYKYRTWNDEYHRRILENNEIYFTSPKDYNDPFDCIIGRNYDNLSKQEEIVLYERSLERNCPTLDQGQIRHVAGNMQKKTIIGRSERFREKAGGFNRVCIQSVGSIFNECEVG